MEIKSTTLGIRRIRYLLSPSWSSGIFALFVSIGIIGGSFFLTLVGNVALQGWLGLFDAYQSSSVGVTNAVVEQHLSANTTFNTAVMLILWGSIGLVVYSIAHSTIRRLAKALKTSDELLHEFNYINITPQSIILELILRAFIRLAALAGWWGLAWLILHIVFPFAIVEGHNAAQNLTGLTSWAHALSAFIVCLISIHGLAILSRLALLHERIFGNPELY